MVRNHTRHLTTTIVLLIVAFSSCGLTACGSSSSPAAQAPSAQEAAIQKRRYEAAVEIFNCARRHGVHLPSPTAAGLNVSGVKGRRHEVVVSDCYQRSLKQAARDKHAEQTERTE